MQIEAVVAVSDVQPVVSCNKITETKQAEATHSACPMAEAANEGLARLLALDGSDVCVPTHSRHGRGETSVKRGETTRKLCGTISWIPGC